MNGIKVTRLSGIDPGIEYKRMDGLGNIPRYQPNQSPLKPGYEFQGLGCTCKPLSGTCDESQQASQLYKEFEQRVKNHLINTYNYIVKNRAQWGIQNPDQVAAAYRKVIDNWNNPTARELAMNEAEKLIQNDQQIAMDFAARMAANNKMRSAVLVKVRSRFVPKMSARRRATVVNGLGNVGDVDYEIMPSSVSALPGDVVGGFNGIGLAGNQASDITVALGGTMIPYNEVDHLGDDGNEEVYLLQGIDGLGKKIQIKIKPKNAINKIKTGVKAVAKAASNTAAKAATGAKTATKKALVKTGELAKKAGKAIIKYNPLFVAGRNGFLLAAKLNIKNISRKLMWAYSSLDQAKKAGFSESDWNNAKAGLKRVEEIFAKKAGGQTNALRKAVLSSKVANQAGLGDPATATALAAALPLIIAIVNALRDVKVAQAGGAPVLDPEGAGGDSVSAEGTPLDAAKSEIDLSSQKDYQNVSDNQSTSNSASGNNSVYNETESTGYSAENTNPPDYNTLETANNPAAETTDTDTSDNKKSGTSGLLLGGLALGLVAITLASGGSAKANLSGTMPNNRGRYQNKVEKFIIN
jgi:hypothetical protein